MLAGRLSLAACPICLMLAHYDIEGGDHDNH